MAMTKMNVLILINKLKNTPLLDFEFLLYIEKLIQFSVLIDSIFYNDTISFMSLN